MLFRLGGLFFVIAVVFWLWAIFDSITSENDRIRNLPKLAWVLIVLLFFELGALAWVLLGRPRNQPFTGPRSPLRPRPSGPQGPVGPDDDPDFLRKI
jgi:hypothetical protein